MLRVGVASSGDARESWGRRNEKVRREKTAENG